MLESRPLPPTICIIRDASISYSLSLAELVHFLADAVESAAEGHVHELRLGVHLEAAQDGLVHFVVDRELLASVLRVGLKSSYNLRLLVS